MGMFKDCGCGCNGAKAKQKFLSALMFAIVFFIVANPKTFQVVRKMFGSVIASPTGCATQVGVLVHSVVFFLVVLGLLSIKRESYVVDDTPAPAPPEMMMPTKTKIEEPVKNIKKQKMAQVNAPSPIPGVFEPVFEPIDGKFNVGCIDLDKMDTSY
jgi:hypothetical protein